MPPRRHLAVRRPAATAYVATTASRRPTDPRSDLGRRPSAPCAPRPSAAPRRSAPEDQVVQSMPDASPTKWHRAHTTWFFEQFLLVPHLPGYHVFDERLRFPVQFLLRRRRPAPCAAAARHAHAAGHRAGRAPIARMSTRRSSGCCERSSEARLAEVLRILEIGLHHEQQHQELLLTDILHAFAQNPIAPPMTPTGGRRVAQRSPRGFADAAGGSPHHRLRGRRLLLRQRRPAHQVFCSRCGSRAASSPMRSGSISWPTAATRRRRSGSPTAGRPCRPKAGTRPAIGASTTAPGSRSRSAAQAGRSGTRR